MNGANIKNLIGVFLAAVIGAGVALAGSQGSTEIF